MSGCKSKILADASTLKNKWVEAVHRRPRTLAALIPTKQILAGYGPVQPLPLHKLTETCQVRREMLMYVLKDNAI